MIQPGDRFGKLTVLRATERRERGYIVWFCCCDCGNTVNIPTNHLARGIEKSCGCSKKMVGRRFSRLVVTEELGTRGKEHLYRCHCDCGNECIATRDKLLRGYKKSCGCLQREVGVQNLKIVNGTSLAKIARDDTQSNNTSGYRGVYPHFRQDQKAERWVAQIGFQGKKYYLGSFDKLEDAIQARKAAEEKFYGELLNQYYGNRESSETSEIEDSKIVIQCDV